MATPVVIEDYDPKWRAEFCRLAAMLQEQLGDLVVSIEHVGSTSVEGLSAKPILDIDVGRLLPEEILAYHLAVTALSG